MLRATISYPWYKREVMFLLNTISNPIDCIIEAHDYPTWQVVFIENERRICAPRACVGLVTGWVREVDLAERMPQ